MKKKIWTTFVVLLGLTGTLIINYSVKPSEYGFGISEKGGRYPMAMIDLRWFELGIYIFLTAIFLQIILVWLLEPSPSSKN